MQLNEASKEWQEQIFYKRIIDFVKRNSIYMNDVRGEN